MRARTWIAAWGVLGVAATFVEAILRLGGRAVAELGGDVTPLQWVVFAVTTLVMVYGEGYRALQRRFAPSVVVRAFEAADRGRPLWAVLAPLYAIALVGAPPRVIARAALGVVLIVGCVLLVRELSAPWRGIVDGAVGLALTWGLVALVACFASALAVRVPGGAPTAAMPREAG